MSRTWTELLGDEPTEADEPERTGVFGRLRESLAKSRRALTAELASAAFDPGTTRPGSVSRRRSSAATSACQRRRSSSAGWRRAGMERRWRTRWQRRWRRCSAGRPLLALTGESERRPRRRRQRHGQDDDDRQARPEASRARPLRLVGAADTFRAAAEEQLEIWAERAGADFVGSPRGADPAAVAFDAVEAARARGRDVVIVDTAGRLHTQANLMAELEKVRRVIGSRIEGAPHETLLVVDATTGQNGLQQARLFGEAVGVTGVALTKLDGSARGGVAIAIAVELGLPVKLVGVGEGVDDLRPFDAHDYARARLFEVAKVESFSAVRASRPLRTRAATCLHPQVLVAWTGRPRRLWPTTLLRHREGGWEWLSRCSCTGRG